MGEVATFQPNEYERVREQTIVDMKAIGTYKDQFLPVIQRYSDMRVQFDILMDLWSMGGCKITEVYTNKAGAANNRKTELYRSIETLRRELTDLESLLGLTPGGLKRISDKALAAAKPKSKLAEALSGGP